MESDLIYTKKLIQPTAVYRRWRTEQGYVDSKGNSIPKVVEQVYVPPALRTGPDPATPPENGSALFFSLPTELRLQIYGYLTADGKKINDTIDRLLYATQPKPHAASTTYAYLYRSPGRLTRANIPTHTVIKLFHISHQIREELLDSCFGDRTFVLEASLYSRSVGGLDVLPPRLGMSAWVKKLLLITTLDAVMCRPSGMEPEKCPPKGMADLRPLQEMVNLKEIRILFRAMDPSINLLQVENNPIYGVISCMPIKAKVFIGLDNNLQEELSRELGASLDYLFNLKENARVAYERLNANMENLTAAQGSLSGCSVNHSNCRFPTCQQADLGLSCVNSQTPDMLPLPGSGSPSPKSKHLRYQCGCIIKLGDKGFANHECRRRKKDDVPLTEALIALQQGQLLAQAQGQAWTPAEAANWRASLQRTRRRWKSWGGQ